MKDAESSCQSPDLDPINIRGGGGVRDGGGLTNGSGATGASESLSSNAKKKSAAR